MNIHRFAVIVAMIVVAAASTLLPHPANFTPLGAIALFAGAQFKSRRTAFAVTFGTLLLRDAVLGFHILMLIVYGCFGVNILLGGWIAAKRTPPRVAGAALLGSIVFFVVTNFAVWAAFDTYAHTPEGLAACYLAAIPYFRNTIASDLLYSMAMFGLLAMVEARIAKLRPAASTQ